MIISITDPCFMRAYPRQVRRAQTTGSLPPIARAENIRRYPEDSRGEIQDESSRKRKRKLVTAFTLPTCEEPDLNRRTTSRLGPEPSSFDLARRSSRHYWLSVQDIIGLGMKTGPSSGYPAIPLLLLHLLVPPHLPIAQFCTFDLP